MAAKTILLIIDPQVDFTTGTLAVPGAKEDYDRIIKLMNGNKIEFNEIHVSLDTHNKDHIGHPSFWIEEKHPEKKHPDPFQVLSITNDGIIKAGETIVKPVDGDIEYAKKYVKHLQNKYNKTKLAPMIWDYHCMVPDKGPIVNINENETNGFGHEVASPLKEKLESPQIKNKVKYHIKGQNNLTEMYSIFGAEFVSEKANKKQEGPIQIEEYDTYDEAITKTNLYVARNEKLMERLLNGGNNIVYVCGQARTHCVKESLKHLLEYAVKKGYDTTKIRLLYNMSSPIPGVLDDIHLMPNVTIAKDDGTLDREKNAYNKSVNRIRSTQETQGGKRRRKTKKRHNKKPKRKVTKKRHHKKTKKRKVRKTKKNKTRKR